jgi:hypothetical protein
VPAQVRASLLKLMVAVAKRQPASSRMLAAIGDAQRQEIRAMTNLSWVDVAQFDRMCAALHASLGERGAEACWRAFMLESFQRPLLMPLHAGAVGIFGRGPASLFRYAPQAWSLVFRGVCDVTFTPDPAPGPRPRQGRVVFGPLCDAVTPAHLAPLALGMSAATIESVGCRGEATRGPDPAPRTIAVELVWHERGARAAS